MDKEKILNLLEQFEKIEIEKGANYPNITMNLEISSNSYGVFNHYIFVKDYNTEIFMLCALQDFPTTVSAPKIEKFEELLSVLECRKYE